MIEYKPLTVRMLQYMDPLARSADMRQDDLHGFGAFEYGQMIGIGGMWFGERTNKLVLSDFSEPVAMVFLGVVYAVRKNHGKTLYKFCKNYVDTYVATLTIPVIAMADRSILPAERFLEHLGFQPTGKSDDRHIEYQWHKQAA